jgi:hypothetical protein
MPDLAQVLTQLVEIIAGAITDCLADRTNFVNERALAGWRFTSWTHHLLPP